MAVTTPTTYTQPSGAAGSMDAALPEYWERVALDTLYPSLVMVEFARRSGRAGVKRIPVHDGEVIHMWRMPKLTPPTSALAETAADPNADTISAAAITAQVTGWGQHIAISHKVPVTLVVNPYEAYGAALRQSAAQKLDDLFIAEITGNGGTFYADGSASLSAASTLSAGSHSLTRAYLEALAAELKANDVPMFPKTGAYLYAAHPYTIKDARGDTGTGGWLDVEKNLGDQPEYLRGAFTGRIAGFDILETSRVPSETDGASSARVYRNIYGGYAGICYVSLAGNFVPPKSGTGNLIKRPGYKPQKNIKLIYKGYKEGGPSNPLERRATLGYYFETAVKILDDDRIGTHLVTR